MSNNKINIQVSRDTHRELTDLCRKNETYDNIVSRGVTLLKNEGVYETIFTQLWGENGSGCGYLRTQLPKNLEGQKVTINLNDLISDLHSIAEDAGVELEVDGCYFLHLPVDLHEKLKNMTHSELEEELSLPVDLHEKLKDKPRD